MANGQSTLNASVSSSIDGPSVRLWPDQFEENPLDSNNSNWMEIRMFNHAEEPIHKVPLHEGYFEMQLPGTLFEQNPKSIDIHWVAFFRG